MGKNKEEEEMNKSYLGQVYGEGSTGTTLSDYYKKVFIRSNNMGTQSINNNPLLSEEVQIDPIPYNQIVMDDIDDKDYLEASDFDLSVPMDEESVKETPVYGSREYWASVLAQEKEKAFSKLKQVKPEPKYRGYKSVFAEGSARTTVPSNYYNAVEEEYQRLTNTGDKPKLKSTKLPGYKRPEYNGGLDPYGHPFKTEEVVNKDLNYRAFLTKDRQSIIYASCPKDFTGTTEDVLNNLNNSVSGFSQLNSIPSNKVVAHKVNRRIDIPKFRAPKPLRTVPTISQEQFYKNTTAVVSFRTGSIYTGDTSASSRDIFQNSINSDNGTCLKNIACTFNDDAGRLHIGFTTGKYIRLGHLIEIVCAKMVRNNELNRLEYVGTNYIKTSTHYQNLNFMVSKFHYDAFRVKIVSSELSGNLFGFKAIKKRMHDQVFTPDQFKITRGYYCKKTDTSLDIVEIKGEDGRYIKFLMSELEFLTIDPAKVGESTAKKSIKIGSVVRIVDDRKIKLEKNQQLTVTNIKKSVSGVKNSYVTLRDSTGESHGVLLKQIKAV